MSSSRTGTGVLLAAALLLGLSPSATAQSVMRGTITDSTGRPLGEVEITLPGRPAVRTTADGAFVLDAIPAGRHRVVFRRIGSAPQELERTFGSADTLVVRVVLGPSSVGLPEVEVLGRAAPRSPAMQTFDRRRDQYRGATFVIDSTLRAAEHSPLSDVLRKVGGLRFVILPNGGGRAVVTSRGSDASLAGLRRDGCYSQIYLNGLRLWTMNDLATAGPYNIDQHLVRDLQGIEVYRGNATLPIELHSPGSDCGTVVLWTREG